MELEGGVKFIATICKNFWNFLFDCKETISCEINNFFLKLSSFKAKKSDINFFNHFFEDLVVLDEFFDVSIAVGSFLILKILSSEIGCPDHNFEQLAQVCTPIYDILKYALKFLEDESFVIFECFVLGDQLVDFYSIFLNFTNILPCSNVG